MRKMLFFGGLFLTAIGCQQSAPEVAPEVEYTTNSYGLDRRNLDESVEPCDDFYQYANGTWLVNNPIPPEYSSWRISDEMRARNEELLRTILEESSSADSETGSNSQKVGDFWKTGMDTETIEAQGAAPIQGDLQRIASIQTVDELVAFVRDAHTEGSAVLFGAFVEQDLKQSDQYIAYATQGGLGLPDRDYYLREDEESAELRTKYVAHVSRMLQLLGDETSAADEAANAILTLETTFAEASLTNVELRDPSNYYNIKTKSEADALTPRFSWTTYFEVLGLGAIDSFSFAHPKFFAAMDSELVKTELSAWQAYLRWHLINGFSPYLSEDFVTADFDFYLSDSAGYRGDAATLETGGRPNQQQLGRGARAGLRGTGLPAGDQGAGRRDDREPPYRSSNPNRGARLDGRGNQGESPGKALSIQLEDWLSRRMARLQRTVDRHRELSRQCSRCQCFRNETFCRQDRQADRPQRVGHAASDDQRLLQSSDE